MNSCRGRWFKLDRDVDSWWLLAAGGMRYRLGWDESCRLGGGIDSCNLDGQRTATGWWERWTAVSWEEGGTAVGRTWDSS